jgi:hypothetical protein
VYDWPRYWSHRERRYIRPSEGAHVQEWGHNWHRGLSDGPSGRAEYNRKTAYYRAVSRLKRRGLLTSRGMGLWITDEGMRVAEGLSVTRKFAALRIHRRELH